MATSVGRRARQDAPIIPSEAKTVSDAATGVIAGVSALAAGVIALGTKLIPRDYRIGLLVAAGGAGWHAISKLTPIVKDWYKNLKIPSKEFTVSNLTGSGVFGTAVGFAANYFGGAYWAIGTTVASTLLTAYYSSNEKVKPAAAPQQQAQARDGGFLARMLNYVAPGDDAPVNGPQANDAAAPQPQAGRRLNLIDDRGAPFTVPLIHPTMTFRSAREAFEYEKRNIYPQDTWNALVEDRSGNPIEVFDETDVSMTYPCYLMIQILLAKFENDPAAYRQFLRMNEEHFAEYTHPDKNVLLPGILAVVKQTLIERRAAEQQEAVEQQQIQQAFQAQQAQLQAQRWAQQSQPAYHPYSFAASAQQQQNAAAGPYSSIRSSYGPQRRRRRVHFDGLDEQ